MVFERLFKGRLSRRPAQAIYEAVVDQARHPAFYTTYGVADRFEQRFDLLVLHTHLVVAQLTRDGATALAQNLFDALFFDMDRTLRAMGVGDMSVGKRVKDMVRAYYGRTAAYEDALSQPGDDALAAALARNVFAAESVDDNARRLARHVRATAKALGSQGGVAIAEGRLRMPDPEETP